MSSTDATINALFDENRKFPPSKEATARAVVADWGIYSRAAADPLAY
jgi:hypothetical protein